MKPELINVPSSAIERLIVGAPKVSKAVFIHTVLSLGKEPSGMPEFAFYAPEPGLIASRVAEMWFTPIGLVCKQTHGGIIVPLSNIKYAFYE